jgi:hypothetical protein
VYSPEQQQALPPLQRMQLCAIWTWQQGLCARTAASQQLPLLQQVPP